MNYNSLALLYVIIGLVVWLVVMLRHYGAFSTSEMLMTLMVSLLCGPFLIIAALIKVVLLKIHDQD